MSEHATIIGGGVIGLSCALALAREGRSVTAISDDAPRSAASWGNAGHIAIEQVEPLASWSAIRSAPARLFFRGGALGLPREQWRAWLPFGVRLIRAAAPSRFAAGKAALSALVGEAMPAWHRLAASLPADGLLREDGHFVSWATANAARAGRAAWAAADIGTARFREATSEELATIARLGREPAGAIRFTNTGQITDLGALADTLEAALRAAGGRIVAGRARIVRDGGAARLLVNGEAVADAGLLVLAAGIRSAMLAAPLGHRVPMIAERGYHLRSTDHDWPADMPPIVFEDRSTIVTRYRTAVQVASIVELGDPDAPPDPAKWARLEDHVAALGLPIRGPFTRWMGARPTLPDYLPAIGRSRRARNLLYAFGHQHLGLTLAAVTGEIVAAIAAGRPASVALDAFDIDRFGRGRT